MSFPFARLHILPAVFFGKNGTSQSPPVHHCRHKGKNKIVERSVIDPLTKLLLVLRLLPFFLTIKISRLFSQHRINYGIFLVKKSHDDSYLPHTICKRREREPCVICVCRVRVGLDFRPRCYFSPSTIHHHR